MIIKGIKYSRFPGMPREWRIVGKDDAGNESYAEFGNLNLLVGKNAAGKSRTLDAIQELGLLIGGMQFVGQSKYHSQHFDFIFTDNGNTYRYVLHFKERVVTHEVLYLNNKEVLNRDKKIIYLEGKEYDMSEKMDEAQLLINRRKEDGNYFFDDLVRWGISLRAFLFSNQLEKDKYVKDLSMLKDVNCDVAIIGLIIPIFYWGREEYGQKFEDEILAGMNALGYNLTDIDIKKTKNGYSVSVEEDGKYQVSQQEMSQGMFRALALFVLIVNAAWRDLSVCILVDDMGEGLDHERAKAFIDLIVKRIYNTQIQYFMSSNERYVMNNIHLKYWSIVERQDEKSVFYNRLNSQKNFDDFKYTGLNNFDFYTTDFYRDGFGDDEEDLLDEGVE